MRRGAFYPKVGQKNIPSISDCIVLVSKSRMPSPSQVFFSAEQFCCYTTHWWLFLQFDSELFLRSHNLFPCCFYPSLQHTTVGASWLQQHQAPGFRHCISSRQASPHAEILSCYCTKNNTFQVKRLFCWIWFICFNLKRHSEFRSQWLWKSMSRFCLPLHHGMSQTTSRPHF